MNKIKSEKKFFFYNYYEKGNETKRLTLLLLIFAFVLCPLFAFFFKFIGAPIIYFYCVLSATLVFPLILFVEKYVSFLKGKISIMYFVFFILIIQFVLFHLRSNNYNPLELIYFISTFSILNFALQRFYLSLIFFSSTFLTFVFYTYNKPIESITHFYVLICCIGVFFLAIFFSRNKMIDTIEDHNSYLKKLVNNIGNGVVLFQIRGNTINLIDYNKIILQLFPHTNEDEIEINFLKIIDENDLLNLNILENDAFFTKQHTLNQTLIYEIKISKLNLKNGVYFLSIIQDITDKVKENNRIKLNEKKYKNLYIRNQTGVFTLNNAAKILDCNPAFLKIFSIPNLDNFQLFKSTEDWKNIRSLILKSETLSNYHYTYEKNLDEVLYLVYNFYYDVESKLIEGNVVDITSLTLSSKALQEKENKYRLIYEESNDSILLLDEDRIVDINQQGLKLFGLDFENIMDNSLWDYTYKQTPDLKNIYDSYFLKLKEEKQIKFSWIFSNNNSFIETSVSIVELIIGDVKYYQCVIQDETARNKYLKNLEQGKKTFESIIENTPEGFLIIQNNKAVFANKEFYQIFNLNGSRSIELNESFFGENFYNFKDILVEHKKDKQKKQKTITFTIDAKQIEIDVTIVSIVFEEEESEMLIFKDVSFQTKLSKEKVRAELAEETSKKLVKEIEERKQIEFKLETEYLRTKAIFDGSENTLLLTLTTDLKISTFNLHSKSYFDVQTKKELYKNIDFHSYFEQIISPLKLRYFNFIASSIRKGKSYQVQLKFINRDNEKKWLEIYINPIKDLNNNVTEISLVAHDITDKKNAEKEILLSLKEKEVLLKEVHHRVKNNLQIISSILNLQSSYIDDKKILEIIEESRNRIRSMAIIHENLYQTTNFSSINFKNYSRELIRNLISSYHVNKATEIQIEENVDLVELSLDQAIPCGLIINELITNSLKYAFPKRKLGVIYLDLSDKNDVITLVVGDNGIGLPKKFDINKTETLGLQLVVTLVEQLDGNIKLETSEGIKYFITFGKQKL